MGKFVVFPVQLYQMKNKLRFFADRTNGRAYASVSVRLSSVTHVLWLNGASYRKTVWRSK